MEKNKAKETGADQQQEALDIAYKAMSDSQRAAVIMLLLGEEHAATIVQFLEPRDVSAIGEAMVDVSDLSQGLVNKVLDEFLSTLEDQTSLGVGSTDYVQNILNRGLGEEKAGTVLRKIMPATSNKGLEILQWMDARSIAEIISGEPPQISAIILSVLEADVAGEVLALLPEESHVEIVHRVATMEAIQPAAMRELEGMMTRQFSQTSAQSTRIGGIEAAATIMNYSNSNVSTSVIGAMNVKDEMVATQIQDKMLTFDDLADVDKKGIQKLLSTIGTDVLMAAIRGADDATKSNFLDNMSDRARLLFLDDLEDKGPIRISEVETAQRDILRIARQLADDGEIVFVGNSNDFV